MVVARMLANDFFAKMDPLRILAIFRINRIQPRPGLGPIRVLMDRTLTTLDRPFFECR